jgi:hypothetical protein
MYDLTPFGDWNDYTKISPITEILKTGLNSYYMYKEDK